MLVGLLIVVDFVVMFLSSQYDTPEDTLAQYRPFFKLAFLNQQLCTSSPALVREVQVASVRMSSSLSRSSPEGEARPGKFNFGVGKGRGDESSGDGGFEAARLLFRTYVESPSNISLVGGTRVQHRLSINNSSNSELANSRDTVLLLDISLFKKGGSGICGAAVADRSIFCM